MNKFLIYLFLFTFISVKAQPDVVSRFISNYNYVQSTMNLPPTYTYEKYGVKQMVPDPITYFEISMRLREQQQAEENAKWWNSQTSKK